MKVQGSRQKVQDKTVSCLLHLLSFSLIHLHNSLLLNPKYLQNSLIQNEYNGYLSEKAMELETRISCNYMILR